MPRPPPNFSAMSEAEVRQMEGNERQHVEARISVLRNIQTLLDAAVVQVSLGMSRQVLRKMLTLHWVL